MFLYFLLMLIGASGFFFTLFLDISKEPTGFYAFVALAAVVGFAAAANIWDAKHNDRKLACPTTSDCNTVVTGPYSKFLGISLEYWGMAYFLLLIPIYVTLIFVPELFTSLMIWGVVVFSLLAGVFSLYLIFIQAVLIKEWCLWCLLSAAMSLVICVFSLVSLEAASELIAARMDIIVYIQYLGYIFGVGGTTASVFLFANFLKDDKIDEKELSALKGVFEMVWIGFVFVLASQFLLFAGFPELANLSSFVVQIIALLVAGISSAVLMIILSPFLIYVPFSGSENEKEESSDSFAALRLPVLVCGSVIIVSWYMAFTASFMIFTSFFWLLFSYIFIIVVFSAWAYFVTR